MPAKPTNCLMANMDTSSKLLNCGTANLLASSLPDLPHSLDSAALSGMANGV